MKIEIYVVTTEISKMYEQALLDKLKVQLCEEFGGLTVIDNCEGLWLDNEEMVRDKTQIWQIVSATVITSGAIMKYAEQLKAVCHQKVQLFTVNGQPYYV